LDGRFRPPPRFAAQRAAPHTVYPASAFSDAPGPRRVPGPNGDTGLKPTPKRIASRSIAYPVYYEKVNS